MPLQKAVRGLPDLLGLYQSGAVPLEFTGAVGLQLNAMPFLAPPAWRWEQFTDNGTLGTFWVIDTVVPEGEKHLVYRMGIRSTSSLGAGQVIQVTPIIAFNDGATQIGLGQQLSSATAGIVAGDIVCLGHEFSTPFELLPGDQLGWLVVHRTAPGNQVWQIGYQYSKFRV